MESVEAAKVDLDHKHATLQEEAESRTKELKTVWAQCMSAQSELKDMQKERERQTQDMMDNIRQLSRELRLHMLVIDSFIPPEFQDQIEQRAQWDEASGEWQVPGVAYTGNSMSRTAPIATTPLPPSESLAADYSKFYLTYGNTHDGTADTQRNTG
jgi:kinesin family protein 3/17